MISRCGERLAMECRCLAYLIGLSISVPLALGLVAFHCQAASATTDSASLNQERDLKNMELKETRELKIKELEQAWALKQQELRQGWWDLWLKVAGGAFAAAAALTAWGTYKVSRRGEITDRFSKAIEHLADDSVNVAKRIGGVYALERIARDSKGDYWSVMEVLTGFYRDRWSWDANHGAAGVDLQVVLTVLGRRKHRYDPRDRRLNLRGTDLRNMDLRDANMRRTDFTDAHLEGARLEGANLLDSILTNADLTGARYDDRTRWPAGVGQDQRGAVRVQ